MDDNKYIDVDPTAAAKVSLPIAAALVKLAPNCRWYIEGDTWEGLVWQDLEALKPSREAVEALAQEILDAAPMVALRKQRDARMRETDWVTLRAMRTGEPIPQEWLDYMQALADITETCPNPKFGQDRTVLLNVTWPTRPDGKPSGPYIGYR